MIDGNGVAVDGGDGMLSLLSQEQILNCKN